MTHSYLEAQPKPDEIKTRIRGYGSWLEIDLDALSHNLAEIRHHTETEVMPCIKNNAYGHGLLPVAAHLADNGVKRFLVAKLKEALAIREHIGAGAVSMDPAWTDEQYRMIAEKGVTQVICTLEAADSLSRAAAHVNKAAGFFVKVDTGLHRVGVRHTEAPDFIERVSNLPNMRLGGIMSTLPQNPDQDRLALDRLLGVEKELRRRGIDPGARSLASSDSTFHNRAAHLDLIRPGAIVYGFYPEAKDIKSGLRLRQALTWKARIEYTKWIEKGESVTYWGRYIAPERMRIGTIHVGFYDGIPRELANTARIRVEGDYRNSLGSVSLNHLVVDLRGTNAQINDVVEVISTSGENTLSKTAETAGWMVYSLLNHLNPTTPRVYIRGGEPTALLESN
jgi:alanine racemase